jgi:hypothetical protein
LSTEGLTFTSVFVVIISDIALYDLIAPFVPYFVRVLYRGWCCGKHIAWTNNKSCSANLDKTK